MGGGGNATVWPFRLELEKFKAVGGGVDRDGNVLQAPWPLQRARIIDGLCQRYSCLPSDLFKEDMDTMFLMHTILYFSGDHAAENNEQPIKSTAHELANISVGL